MQSPSQHLIKLTAQPNGAPQQDRPLPERRVQGEPLRSTWNLVQADLQAGQVFCGIWRSEPGR